MNAQGLLPKKMPSGLAVMSVSAPVMERERGRGGGVRGVGGVGGWEICGGGVTDKEASDDKGTRSSW